jgi:hypothetical protein
MGNLGVILTVVMLKSKVCPPKIQSIVSLAWRARVEIFMETAAGANIVSTSLINWQIVRQRSSVKSAARAVMHLPFSSTLTLTRCQWHLLKCALLS